MSSSLISNYNNSPFVMDRTTVKGEFAKVKLPLRRLPSSTTSNAPNSNETDIEHVRFLLSKRRHALDDASTKISQLEP